MRVNKYPVVMEVNSINVESVTSWLKKADFHVNNENYYSDRGFYVLQDGIAKLTPVLPNIPLFYCGSRDYLFKAVARINDEDDLNQWFCNENGEMRMCNLNHVDSYEHLGDSWFRDSKKMRPDELLMFQLSLERHPVK